MIISKISDNKSANKEILLNLKEESNENNNIDNNKQEERARAK